MHCEPRNGSPINEEASFPGVVAFAGTAGPSGVANSIVDGVPHCEKADLEVHEKETDLSLPSIGSSSEQQAVAGGSGVGTTAM